MVTVFITLTRGGIVSMLIAISFTTLSLTWRRTFKSYGWVMVIMALIAFTCILYTGFDAVYDRLATLRNFNEAESGRLQILKDILIMSTNFLFSAPASERILLYIQCSTAQQLPH